jgi:hypothetical protein
MLATSLREVISGPQPPSLDELVPAIREAEKELGEFLINAPEGSFEQVEFWRDAYNTAILISNQKEWVIDTTSYGK